MRSKERLKHPINQGFSFLLVHVATDMRSKERLKHRKRSEAIASATKCCNGHALPGAIETPSTRQCLMPRSVRVATDMRSTERLKQHSWPDLIAASAYAGCNGHALNGAIETTPCQVRPQTLLERCNGHAFHGAIETQVNRLLWRYAQFRCNGHAIHGAIET